MLPIPKKYVLDEEQKPLAVQIPIAVYNQIEEILEDFGLAKLMEEVENDEQLSGDIAYSFYQSLKEQNVGN
jgi:ASC-1-like (ASCH) protein